MATPKLRESLSRRGIWVAIVSEFLATFLLVYLVIGIAYINFNHADQNSTMPFNAQIIITGISCGTVVAGIVFVFGYGFPNGSAHLNPAFTLGCLVLGKVTVVRAIFYVMAQCLGAIFGAGLLYGCFPAMRENYFPCTVLIGVGPLEGAGIEFAGTFTLVLFALGIIAVAERNNYGAAVVSVGIGVVIGVLIIIAAPYTGASFNPARSLGPAVLFGGQCWQDHWVYWAAPLLGGLVGGAAIFVLRTKDDDVDVDVDHLQIISDEGASQFSSAAFELTVK